MSTTNDRSILVIDDEAPMRHMLRLVLEKEGFRVREAADGEEGLERLRDESFGAVLCDIRMPRMDGSAFLKELIKEGIQTTVIMMSAYGTLDTAIECMKLGAYDYISKPFKKDEVVLTLRKAQERLRLQSENRRLKEELKRAGSDTRKIVYRSAAMANVMDLVEKAADSASSVLITGETGTGKELVARALHERSRRRDAPFVAVNCSAISSGLMESELFGHAKGAFTGADRGHDGLFRAAEGGTLFLDEIGELPLELQPKLLRVLQEKEVRRVGESRAAPVDVRIVSATASDLKEEVAKRRFRDDLFYRLAVVEIALPPLRERREDIPLLIEECLARISVREGGSVPTVSADAMAALQDYHWPGNVRELVNALERALIFSTEGRIEMSALPWERRRRRREEDDFSLKTATSRLEQEFIRKALDHSGGNRTQAARLLEISLRGLLYKMKEYGIE